jgi:hypothetical protein
MQNFEFLALEEETDRLFRSLRNDSEERTFLLIRGGSLKSFL